MADSYNCPQCGAPLNMGVNNCKYCGETIQNAPPQRPPQYAPPQYAPPQPQVVYVQQAPTAPIAHISSKSRLVALLLCIFLGYLGIHRFYAGKMGTGLLWLFTGGMFGIGWFVDFILILCGSFTDQAGLPLTNWNS